MHSALLQPKKTILHILQKYLKTPMLKYSGNEIKFFSSPRIEKGDVTQILRF